MSPAAWGAHPGSLCCWLWVPHPGPSPHGTLSGRLGGTRPLGKGTEAAQTVLPWGTGAFKPMGQDMERLDHRVPLGDPAPGVPEGAAQQGLQLFFHSATWKFSPTGQRPSSAPLAKAQPGLGNPEHFGKTPSPLRLCSVSKFCVSSPASHPAWRAITSLLMKTGEKINY